MIHWTDQIKELLNEPKMQKSSNTCSPLQEIELWKSRSAKLMDISKQLQKPEVRHAHNILQLSKSVYVQRFSKLAEELKVNTSKASLHKGLLENTHFLMVSTH